MPGRKPKKKTREQQGRGKGEYGDYKAWERANEHTRGLGTRTIAYDYVTGRSVDVLSEGELKVWRLLRFNPNVEDINEQYPLNKEVTDMICKKCGWNASKNPNYVKTTDFLVRYKDGSRHAFSVKPNDRALNSVAVCRSLIVEKIYWGLQKVPWDIIYSDNIDHRLTDNIRLVTRYYDIRYVHNKVSAMKFLIARKIFSMSLKELLHVIDYKELADANITDELYEKIMSYQAKAERDEKFLVMMNEMIP